MGVKSPSGFYVGRKPAALLALLLAALLVALLVLAVLYRRSLQELAVERLRKGDATGPPTPSAGPSASTRPPGPWDRLRLPATLAPVHYSLLLWPHLAPGLPEPRTFSGQVNITVRCSQETATVLLHSHQLTYRAAVVWGPLGGPRSGANTSRVPLAELWLAKRHQFAVLELRERLRAGALYELRFAFDGLLNDGFRGLFRSGYEDRSERR